MFHSTRVGAPGEQLTWTVSRGGQCRRPASLALHYHPVQRGREDQRAPNPRAVRPARIISSTKDLASSSSVRGPR